MFHHLPYRKIALTIALLLLSLALMQFLQSPQKPPSEKINLALRRTAHHLLAAAGDSNSRIPPVQQLESGIWRIRLERAFDYNRLPSLLQESFDRHGIHQTYDVAVLRCLDDELQLGYNALDYARDSTVPCGGRDMNAECYNLQITFADATPRFGLLWALLLGGLALAGAWFFLKKRRPVPVAASPAETTGLTFGNSRLDVANQALMCGSVRHFLTYREAKLLHLFASHPNQLLEREYILQQVWADEGILVGRSVDVFVSRLRKMLRDDPSVRIAAVHGVGYRLETARRDETTTGH
ncbi:MAG: winged helix-turn-helix domain-containing protein [Saprospiraceae bacterium]